MASPDSCCDPRKNPGAVLSSQPHFVLPKHIPRKHRRQDIVRKIRRVRGIREASGHATHCIHARAVTLRHAAGPATHSVAECGIQHVTTRGRLSTSLSSRLRWCGSRWQCRTSTRSTGVAQFPRCCGLFPARCFCTSSEPLWWPASAAAGRLRACTRHMKLRVSGNTRSTRSCQLRSWPRTCLRPTLAQVRALTSLPPGPNLY
jgi:hypothetical protein